jgi:hypothetical protein
LWQNIVVVEEFEAPEAQKKGAEGKEALRNSDLSLGEVNAEGTKIQSKNESNSGRDFS